MEKHIERFCRQTSKAGQIAALRASAALRNAASGAAQKERAAAACRRGGGICGIVPQFGRNRQISAKSARLRGRIMENKQALRR